MSRQTILVLQALWELLRYDLVITVFGFRRIHQGLADLAATSGTAEIAVDRLCTAMTCATCLYWKPVHCLQRSVATVRLLRRHRWQGRLVIGYRAVPFFSHAWAEVEGRVVNDSPVYQKRLRTLATV
jgi:hypothetical protein